MKKIITAGVTLLSIVALAACSSKSTTESSSQASSTVEQTSTSESKAASSGTSSKTEKREIVLLTDEEIDSAKTIGDMKTLYGKLIDNYKKYVTEIGEQIPASERDAYDKQVKPAVEAMESSRKTFNETLSTAGSDDTAIPEEGRTLFVQQLKTGRDTMKTALEGAYKTIEPLISGQ